jgi:hypothetical protein
MWTPYLFWNRNGGLGKIMANPNEILNRLTAGVSSAMPSAEQLAGASLSDGVRGLNAQLEQLRGLFQQQTASTKENTEALSKATGAQGNTVMSTLGDVAKTATSSFGAGTLLSPLLSGVLKLFGRDRTPEPPAPLPTFSLPRSIQVDGAVQSNGIAPVHYDQQGLPRVVTPPAAASQVTVQVNAMDARSFLDRSDDIARAVKEAMLHSHSVNDVIGEL